MFAGERGYVLPLPGDPRECLPRCRDAGGGRHHPRSPPGELGRGHGTNLRHELPGPAASLRRVGGVWGTGTLSGTLLAAGGELGPGLGGGMVRTGPYLWVGVTATATRWERAERGLVLTPRCSPQPCVSCLCPSPSLPSGGCRCVPWGSCPHPGVWKGPCGRSRAEDTEQPGLTE